MLDLQSELDYVDPFAPVFWADEVVARAKRGRRNRRLTLIGAAAAGVLAVLAVFGVPGWWDRADNEAAGANTNSYGTNLADPVPGEHLASDPVVMIAASGGWQTFVFYSTAGALCIGAVELSGRNRGYVMTKSAPALGRPNVLSIDGQGTVVVGFVNGSIGSVHVRDDGHTYVAKVVPAPMHGMTDLGAYAVWLPRNASTTGVAVTS
jgi:hypothetical protein